MKFLTGLALSAALLGLPQPGAAQESGGRPAFMTSVDNTATSLLQQRRQAVSALDDEDAARARQAAVRTRVLKLIGGLPDLATALNIRVTGSQLRDGIRIDNLIYDSLPGYAITANLYRPDGKGPFPAILIAPGHGLDGKIGNYGFAMALAQAGFVALAYDVVGEGERQQYFDPQTGESRAGRPTGQHSMAAWQTLLAGDQVARYFIHDAMRGIDLLSARPDVDAQRIGAFGCSGGGTVTAYLAALDPRVRATAVGCYVNDYAHLLSSVGPQDGEQSIAGFISAGLDIPDWVELAAPRPYAVISTTADMFPFAGARAAVDEAKRFWSLFGAASHFQWITGAGPHGHLEPVNDRIIAFFTTAFGLPAAPPFHHLDPPDPLSLWATATGQLATSLGGETLWSLNLARATSRRRPAPAVDTPDAVIALRDRLVASFHRLAHQPEQAGEARVEVLNTTELTHAHLSRLQLRMPDGLTLQGLLAVPTDTGDRQKSWLIDTAQDMASWDDAAALPARLAAHGTPVMVLQVRAAGGSEEIKSAVLGDWNLLGLRALLVNRNILGERVQDSLRALSWLRQQPGIDPDGISIHGAGALGPVALHSAVIDTHVAGLRIEGSLADYAMAIEQPLMRGTPEIAIPGVLREYDLHDWLLATWPRPVTVVDARDAVGQRLTDTRLRERWQAVFDTDRKLGTPDRVQLAHRSERAPLALD